MRKTLSLFFIFILSLVFLTGCATKRVLTRNYYILEYYSHTEKPELKQLKPLNHSVYIRDSYVSNTYDRKQIVMRHFGPRISYLEDDMWSMQLDNIIPNLITRRMIRYNLFKQVQRDIIDGRPDYEIVTNINNIELFESEFLKEAHVNMEFILREVNRSENVVRHLTIREEIVLDDQLETFVQQVNEIILEETDKFIVHILDYFAGNYSPGEIDGIVQTEADSLLPLESGEGRGLLLLPSLTKTDFEPAYKIYSGNKDENFIEGIIGQAIPLESGTYSIVYGSGNETQMITKHNVQIRPRYKTIIEPDWSCLIVDVVDEKRNFAQVRYEIFNAETGESYGTELTVEKELGEQQKIWILPAGLYKITINSEPFNTYRDFTTIDLREGKAQKLTMVVDRDEDDNPTNMIGAGILEDIEDFASEDTWKAFSALHGNFNMNQDNETDKDNPEYSITLNSQFDNRVVYENYPFNYTMRSLIEAGVTKTQDTDFRISADDFDLKNTFIFFIVKRIGLYTRADLNTHLFQAQDIQTSNFNYIKKDINGNEVDTVLNTTKMTLQNSFYPLVMKEGIGINLRVFSSPRATLNLRSGFGLRQELNDGVYVYSGLDNNNYRIYTAQESVFSQGTELSLIGNFQLPFNLTYSTNADVLFPFEKGEATTVEWENVFNLKLLKHISIDYKLKLRNKQTDANEDYIVDTHSLFVRLTYFFR